jgi:hypothetical protein
VGRSPTYVLSQDIGNPRTYLKVTSRWVVEFLDTVRGQFCDYAAVSSGIVTSLVSAVSRAMECSLK